jgi:hypothetical protein
MKVAVQHKMLAIVRKTFEDSEVALNSESSVLRRNNNARAQN